MWMGGGMAAAPVVFPAGLHQYMQRMVAAGPPPHVSSMPGTMPFMAPPPAVQGPTLPDPYAARYLAVDHHQPPPPPPMVAPPPYTVELLNLDEFTFSYAAAAAVQFADRFQQHCLQAAMGFYQLPNPATLPPPPSAVPAASPSDGILHKRYGTPQNVNLNVM